MATTNINVRVDSKLKADAETLFSDLGMNMSTAIIIFLKTAVRQNGIPFEVSRFTPKRCRRMLKIVPSHRFKRDLKTAQKRGLDMGLLRVVVNALAAGEKLDSKYRDHDLTGDYAGFRECHIQSDWLLVYRIEQEELELFLFRTGTHSDLF